MRSRVRRRNALNVPLSRATRPAAMCPWLNACQFLRVPVTEGVRSGDTNVTVRRIEGVRKAFAPVKSDPTLSAKFRAPSHARKSRTATIPDA